MKSFYYARHSTSVPWASMIKHHPGGDEEVVLDFVQPMFANAIAYMRNIGQ